MGIFDKLNPFLNKTPSPATTPPAAPLTQSAKKILVVEDDEALRSLYVDVLKAEHFDVLAAENGQIGLEITQREKPQLLLLDLMMPVMDGKTLLRTLRNMPEFKDLPVIVLTNAGDVDSIKETKFYSNANSFLIKANVTPADIVQHVKTYLPS